MNANLFLRFILIILSLSFGTGFCQTLTADQIIQKVNELMSPQTSQSRARMKIVTSSGSERSFLYESWSKDRGEKNLIRYLEPRRVKGQASLMLNYADDIWMYFPRTKRVRKLASHAKKQKVQGSDFSYEDMGTGDTFINEFTAELLADQKIENLDCYKLNLKRKTESDISYSRCIMWVSKENFIPVVIDYYSENDPTKCDKRLIQSDIKIIDGIPTAMKMVMTNLNDNTTTEMELLEVNYNLELEDNMFTERGLKK